ncbi:MAG: ABC transporter [Treponema bryantii]|nr:ABC transporter [Treponema bryantii]
MKKFINWLKSPSSDFALFIVFLLLLNIVSYNSFFRLDLTEPKSYSLSKPSKQVVKNLQEPLTIRVFFDKNLPTPYNSVAQYVEDLLAEYDGVANKNFSVINMDLSKEESLAMASDYGLSQIQIQEIKNNEVGFKQVYMGLVLSYGDSIETLDSITSTEGFEYKLTTKISKMISTADTLANLKQDEKINVTLYFSPVLKNMGISGCAELEEIVETTFKEVNKQNKDRLDYKVVNPSESETIEFVQKYGIQAIQYKSENQQKVAALGLVVEYNDDFRVIPVQIERSLFGYVVSGLETIGESINESLQSLMSNVQSIGYVTGHGELSLQDERQALNFNKMVSAHYQIEELNLVENDIPMNMSCIVINGPKADFAEEELYKIDQFIMRGGNVMFFVDSLVEQGGSPYQAAEYVPNELNIDKLLNKYGVKRNYDYVMDTNCYTTSSPEYGKVNLYWAPIMQKDSLAKKSVITQNLGYLIFLQNGSLDISGAENNSNLKSTVLVKSSPESWAQSERIMLNPIFMTPPEAGNFAPQNLAVMIEGKFDSAYTEKPEFETSDESAEATENQTEGENQLTTENHLASAKLPGKIFVTGSSYVTTYQILDGQDTSPISMFFLNVIDYLNGNEEVCTMRTKGLGINVLTIKSPAFATIAKYFNQFGLVILVAVAGLIVVRSRAKRRKQIREKYNPNDSRQVK